MGKLILEARGARTIDRGALIALSVTDEGGKPVADLGAADLVVRAIVTPDGAVGVSAAAVEPAGDGFYTVRLVPAPAGSWRPGSYLLGLSVARRFDRGQCLAELVLA